jgi:hypothetical protein
MSSNQEVQSQKSTTKETQPSASLPVVPLKEQEMSAVVVGGIGNNKYLLVKCRGWWVKNACQI